MLKRAKWNLKLPFETAMKTCPDVVVSLSDSQCLRFIDDIQNKPNVVNQIKNIKKKIKYIKSRPKSKENKVLISNYYKTLYNLQFQPDYVCVIMNSKSDYDRANLGFTINFGEIDGKELIIKYRRLLGTNGGIKNSTIVYVNELIYNELKTRLDNGRNMNEKLVPAKLEAYQALICSGSIPLPPPKGFIVVKDCITCFKEDVILINDDVDGEPLLTYEKDYEIEHNDSDGYGLMLPSYSRKVNEFLSGDGEKTIAGMNTRYAWTKGMIYTFDFIEFAEKIAGTYEVVDVWGDKRDVRDAEVILTESMLKLWGGYKNWEDYYDNCQKNHYEFSVTKTTPSELENVRDTNYQFLQSYEFDDKELAELCKPTVEEIKDVVGMDYRKSLVFLTGFGLDEVDELDDYFDYSAKALMIDKRMINDPFIRKKIHNMIRKRIEMAERGAIRVSANYAMISGDPYALAQSIFGLKITGLLSAGEVYHKYWIDKGAEEITCFRAPMTCHNNIRKMKLSKSEQAAYWYKYIDTALIYNAWDSSCEAENGADKDGDTNMCTDNPVIVRNTLNTPTIICLQKKADKIVPTEKDIIAANKLAFNDDIGVVTNHITSMIEVQAGFSPESAEYKELAYRIMCGQLYQQNTIDRAKGIIAKSMPSYWCTTKDYNIQDDDSEYEKSRKIFNYNIVASRKPYFMTYVYPKLRTQTLEYIKNNNKNVLRHYFDYNIHSIRELENYPQKNTDMEQFIEYYHRLFPVGDNDCIVNRICHWYEQEFSGIVSKQNTFGKFDYSILKSNVDYSRSDFQKIKQIYTEYLRRVEQFQKRIRTEKVDKDYCWLERHRFSQWFKSECEKVCPNQDELCDIVLDICYRTEKSKQFAWDICGETIIQNLLKKNNYKISYPKLSNSTFDFTYAGKNFIMQSKEIRGDNV
ncbi:MAG: hypothetical protein II304_08670 [Bacteroidales bacterium]|nr:hypothetical protein [Bacteroidales bacterium]